MKAGERFSAEVAPTKEEALLFQLVVWSHRISMKIVHNNAHSGSQTSSSSMHRHLNTNMQSIRYLDEHVGVGQHSLCQRRQRLHCRNCLSEKSCVAETQSVWALPLSAGLFDVRQRLRLRNGLKKGLLPARDRKCSNNQYNTSLSTL